MMIGFRKLGFRDDLLEYGRSLRNLAKCNLSENSDCYSVADRSASGL